MSETRGGDARQDRRRLRAGTACCLLGLLLSAAIHLHPAALRAPAWVADLAALAFVAAGLAAIAQASGRARLGELFACVLLALFAVIGWWIAIGPGPRQCMVAAQLPGAGLAAGGSCRVAFGFGALLVTALLAIALSALARRRPPG